MRQPVPTSPTEVIMSRLLSTVARLALPAFCAISVSLIAAAPAAAATPVGPNQYFAGNVNGSYASSPIRVACPSTSPTATGHPLPNQYVYASLAPTTPTLDIGYTGAAATSLVVTLRFSNSTSGNVYTVGSLAAYDTRLAIPTALTLPCSGSGLAYFTPRAASSTSRADTVAVTIEAHP
ncbi:hypothetical protein F4553_001540 [Allocatelliglobosispora scoriae]|uniref:Uncharacterized protein n=1 Tax=Allocatelliglobosispora scoriae TaxID=643052 RepID=A0A841BMT8_9ACTN|nr:hypothetical protein [Allocatelliglobosispora scoriae]MBB5868161.1 hypothetical protein [Allocatelliglobosispora scoriae]